LRAVSCVHIGRRSKQCSSTSTRVLLVIGIVTLLDRWAMMRAMSLRRVVILPAVLFLASCGSATLQTDGSTAGDGAGSGGVNGTGGSAGKSGGGGGTAGRGTGGSVSGTGGSVS